MEINVINILMIDVIMPAHPKDLGVLELCLKSIKDNVEGVRRIILISHKKLSDNAEWFNLDLFPFDGDIVTNIHGKSKKNGWYLMQLIKLYAPVCIPDVTENTLSCDTDTIFLNPVSFLDDNKHPVWSSGIDLAKGGIQVLLGGTGPDSFLGRLNPEIYTNGIIHKMHTMVPKIEPMVNPMIFNRNIMTDLMGDIEKFHNNKSPFWKILLQCSNAHESGCGEHQLYFLYCLSQREELCNLAYNYKWKIACEYNGPRHPSNQINLLPVRKVLDKYQNEGWHWLAFQSHMRGIRIHNYKELCLTCGKQKDDCSINGCDGNDARGRESANI